MQLFTAQSIGQRQSVVVTAQLQQAIQLLQMGNTDLQSFIESQAEENPFLDLSTRGTPAAAASQSARGMSPSRTLHAIMPATFTGSLAPPNCGA